MFCPLMPVTLCFLPLACALPSRCAGFVLSVACPQLRLTLLLRSGGLMGVHVLGFLCSAAPCCSASALCWRMHARVVHGNLHACTWSFALRLGRASGACTHTRAYSRHFLSPGMPCCLLPVCARALHRSGACACLPLVALLPCPGPSLSPPLSMLGPRAFPGGFFARGRGPVGATWR